MKLTRLLIVGSSPQFKCGGALGEVADVLGVGASIYNSERNINLQKENVDKQLAAQKEENSINRDWQTNEAEKARQFNTSERLGSQEHQVNMLGLEQQNAKEMAAVNAKYNSPQYQSQELMKAGINPQVYFGGSSSSFGGSSQGSPTAPSVPSGHPSPMVSGITGLNPIGFQPADLHIPQLISSLAEFSNSRINKSKMPAEIKKILSDVKLNESDARLRDQYRKKEEILTEIEKSSLPAKISKAFFEAGVLMEQRNLLIEQQKTEEANRLELKAREMLHNATSKLHGEQAFYAQLMNNRFDEIYELDKKLKLSVIADNQASAAEHNASASALRYDTSFRKAIESFKFDEVAKTIDKLGKENNISDEDLKIKKALVSKAMSEAEIAANKASHAEELFWKDFVMDVVVGASDAFSNVASGRAMLKNAKTWSKLSDTQQKKVESDINDVYETISTSKNTYEGKQVKTISHKRPAKK